MGADQSINPTRGGRQTQVRSLFLMICPGINPTRGGRQTILNIKSNCIIVMYQSHKGWTSNGKSIKEHLEDAEVSIPQGVDVKLQMVNIPHLIGQCINPTRGGRQTWLKSLWGMYGGKYQSHKGWTSNKVKMQLCYIFHHVSIPQGVDVKHDRYYICSRRSGAV